MLLPCCRHYLKYPFTILLKLSDCTEMYTRGAFLLSSFVTGQHIKTL